MSLRDTKENENVIPAKAGIQRIKNGFPIETFGNDSMGGFSGENKN